ncbi:hypothetical protein F9K33_01860 [bacterium]|nr:MAG: hypothetical protein F9K33_01860 [bacterium]
MYFTGLEKNAEETRVHSQSFLSQRLIRLRRDFPLSFQKESGSKCLLYSDVAIIKTPVKSFLSFAGSKERNKEKSQGYGKTPELEFANVGGRKQFLTF